MNVEVFIYIKNIIDEHFKIKKGDYLLSHPVTQAVPSAFRGLTSLFGMGRGVTPWL